MSEDAAFPDGAVPIPLTCPECSGPLFERRTGGGSTFQCLVGHRYSAASLDAEQAGGLEAVLWHAVRGLRERAELLHRIAGQPQAASSRLAQRYEARARACEEQADAIVVAIERLGATTDQEARATA
jgi:two-component system chemotaxis response regulator CheB